MFRFALQWFRNTYLMVRQVQNIIPKPSAGEGLKMGHEDNSDTLSSRCALAESAVSDLKGQMRDLKKQEEELVAEIKSLQVSLRRTKQDSADFKRRLERLKSRQEATEAAYYRIEKENEHLSRSLETALQQLDSCKADLRGAQHSAFKHAQPGGYVEEDDSVREYVDGLYKNIRQWAKSYCIQSLENLPMVPEDVRRRLQDFISERAYFPNQDALFEFKHPFLILAALLSAHLEKFVFKNQFFVFQEPGSLQSSRSFSQTLKHTFHQLGTDPEVHACRASFMRLIFPRTRHKSDHAIIDGKAITIEKLEALYKEICDSFLSGPISPLMANLDTCRVQERDNDLLQIVRNAGRIYSYLLTQLADYGWLDSRPFLNRPFLVSSTDMRPDRLHKLIDEEDKSCDKWRVSIVISPVVFCYGNSNGENYTERRVITKSVVFLTQL